jgi:phosphoribosylformylglycinamidine cyclo-ligase
VTDPSEAYRAAGVDTEAAAKAVSMISELALRARRPEVADELGGFAGLFRIGEGRLLAAATDGVGTKLEIARLAGRLETVGIDLVAMCADDVVCTGAEPVFFLDYLAMGKVEPTRVASIVSGVAEGCERAGCALLGGETAEHPGTMPEDGFDLAGFCVGIVNEDAVMGPKQVRTGDALIGLPSSGVHANGFSLIRSALLPRFGLGDAPPGIPRTLADELLEPCVIYTPTVLALHRAGLLRAAAHITGGGFLENVPRTLAPGLGARIRRGSWAEPPIFGVIQEAAGASDHDMFATFNMGIGMVLVVEPAHVEEVLAGAVGAVRLGDVITGAGASVV